MTVTIIELINQPPLSGTKPQINLRAVTNLVTTLVTTVGGGYEGIGTDQINWKRPLVVGYFDQWPPQFVPGPPVPVPNQEWRHAEPLIWRLKIAGFHDVLVSPTPPTFRFLDEWPDWIRWKLRLAGFHDVQPHFVVPTRFVANSWDSHQQISWFKKQVSGFWDPFVAIPVPQTPATIFGANLVAWYKADVGVSTSGSNVTGWADQSGNGNNMTVYAGTPTFSSTGFNSSYPGITLPTATEGLNSSAFNINSHTASWFFVINVGTSTATSFGGICSYFDNSAAPDYVGAHGLVVFSREGTTANTLATNYTSATAMFDTTETDGTNIRLGLTFDNNTPAQASYVNNVNNQNATVSNAATLGTASSLLTLGANPVRNNINGTIFAEVVMVNVVATIGQRSSLDTYFKNKWGL